MIHLSDERNPLTDSIWPGYEWTRAFFQRAAIRTRRASKELSTLESMIAGAIAGSATVLITNPIWVINTRMTARQSESSSSPSSSGTLPPPSTSPAADERKQKSPSTISTLLALLREEGPRSLFAGVLPALVLVINPILQYTIFERLKNLLIQSRQGRGITAMDVFALGAIGKLLATTITYPYITIKSRMHVAKRDKDRDGKQDREGMGEALRRCVREEGWSGLYRGPRRSISYVYMFYTPHAASTFQRDKSMLTPSQKSRHWTKSDPVGPDSRIFICFQRCAL